MKFCCTSATNSKQRKSLNKNNEKKIKRIPIVKINHSLSTSAVSYATISSSPCRRRQSMTIKKYDSGFSETATTMSSHLQESILEQILAFERVYYEKLKVNIIKYSRPLRRYLNADEIVDLFQNIEKISAISESVVRQCEKLLDVYTSDIPISTIYQSWSGVMIDSYQSYLSRTVQAQATLRQCQNKIAYFLQLPTEIVEREIAEFIDLPVRHICLLNELLQSLTADYTKSDWKIIQDVRLLARQASASLQSYPNEHDNTISTLESSICCCPNVTLETSQDTTLQSHITPTIMVLQRVNKEPWEPKRLELSDSRLLLIQIDRNSISPSPPISLSLANVVHIQEDAAGEEIRLVIAANSVKSSLRRSSVKLMRVYLRFEHKNDYFVWFHHLTHAIQQAKDQSWTNKNELVI